MPSLLPLPVSSSIDRLRGSSIARHRHRINSLSALLFARARTTNLAVLILSSICCLSLYLNFRSIFSSTSFRSQSDFQHSQHPFSPFRTHPLAPSFSQFKRLVIVPGHAIYIGANPVLHDPLDPEEWILEPYQARHPPSSIGAFINHIQTAVHTVSTDSSALLVYSGGQTRHQANQSTEAGSYSRLANQLGLHDQLSLGPLQTTTEDFALDSWTNLIYSVARFKEYTGDYPTQITVVGHSVKSKRFNELHRKAMRWPQERFEYIGLDPINLNRFTTTSTSFSSQETIDLKEIESSMILGEKKVYLEFEKDLYGCNLSLMEKRKKRNGFRRFHPYLTSNPEIRGLLDWCPINGIDEYTGSLPWA
ncbi:hypothetical protein MJO28_016276 [Puccinia striiformis f. sp. tritici]|uniref:DUF218 domain-containing protein n=2 Tax=Puccinia striiformis TaxID=27350 RepID=A0A2S4VFB0_9BASI|nr:hypothetical protein Pst134EA_030596 [Puccinia striiformis f. sp. tritici]KAH9446687.1 hypothetical protein Pst134EA_030596 [Puccinia striiformis f. sp. tritici]KAI7935405.1 hypothetical protein MJO28_016276 [Puccinia striiformis f. sp. tritici]POW08226.1 hypothetical protein PSTT_07663 [Puccinia striiformis]